MTHLEEFDRIIVAEAHKWKIPGMTWEDIAQEVRIHLWQKENLYDIAKSTYKTWANTVMRNCIYHILIKSGCKKAQYLNQAVSTDKLKENGYDICRGAIVYSDIEDDE